MRLSTKGRYAVTSMLNLAIHDRHDTVTLANISRSQGISLSYLEQLFAKLRKHQLVEGVRGPGGGYRLAKPLNQITVAQIITAVDEREDERANATAVAVKERSQRALTRELWKELSERFYEFLDSITLAEFADRPDLRKNICDLEKQAVRHVGKRSAV